MWLSLPLTLALGLVVDGLRCVSSNGANSLSPHPENRTVVECDEFCSTSTMIVENYEMEDNSTQTIFTGITRSCGFKNRFIGINGGCMTVTKFGRRDLYCLCLTDYCNI